ncbi:hypothetical protein R8Z50_09490 [Longispora sp. K20-0274]|uniref:hypothetical protein n=1 Tax=Longispora sp. K20-0274 TaxID=3088255 RepID=UPI00399BB964
MWPFKRAASADAPSSAERTSGAARGPEVARAPVGAWRDLPPLQRVLGDHPVTNPTERFSAGLASWQDPTFLAPLRHAVGPAEPSGVVEAAPTPAPTPAPEEPAAGTELPVVEQGPVSRLVDRVVQRFGGGPGAGTAARPMTGSRAGSAGGSVAASVSRSGAGAGRADGGPESGGWLAGPPGAVADGGPDSGAGGPVGDTGLLADGSGPVDAGLEGIVAQRAAVGSADLATAGPGAFPDGPGVADWPGLAKGAELARGTDLPGGAELAGGPGRAGGPGAVGTGARRSADVPGTAVQRSTTGGPGGTQGQRGSEPSKGGLPLSGGGDPTRGTGDPASGTATGGSGIGAAPGPAGPAAGGGGSGPGVPSGGSGPAGAGGYAPGTGGPAPDLGGVGPGRGSADGGFAVQRAAGDGPLLGTPDGTGDALTSAHGLAGDSGRGPRAGGVAPGGGQGHGQPGDRHQAGQPLTVSRSVPDPGGERADGTHGGIPDDSGRAAGQWTGGPRTGGTIGGPPAGGPDTDTAGGAHADYAAGGGRPLDGGPHGPATHHDAPVVQRAASDAPLLGDPAPAGRDHPGLERESDRTAPGHDQSAPAHPELTPAPGSAAGPETASGPADGYPGATATWGESASASTGLISGDLGPGSGAVAGQTPSTGGPGAGGPVVQRTTGPGTPPAGQPAGAPLAPGSAGGSAPGAAPGVAGQAGNGAAGPGSAGDPPRRRLGLGAPLAPGELPPGLQRTADGGGAGFPDLPTLGGPSGVGAPHGFSAVQRIPGDGPDTPTAVRQLADDAFHAPVVSAPTLGASTTAGSRPRVDEGGDGLPDTGLTWSDDSGSGEVSTMAAPPADNVRLQALAVPDRGPSAGLLGQQALPLAVQRSAGSAPARSSAPAHTPAPAGPNDPPSWPAPVFAAPPPEPATPVEVQRAVEPEPPSMVPVLTRTPETVVQRAEEAAPAPAPGTGDGAPEELLKKLFDPLLRRLKAELRLDRDRRGALTDLRH